MTIQVLGVDGAPFDQTSVEIVGGRFLRAICRLVLSGSYVTAGDTLDLTNAGGTPSAPTTVIPAQVRGLASVDFRPFGKLTSSFSAIGGQYEILTPGGVIPVPIASVNAMKLKLWQGGNSEYAAGAYGADVLADILIAEFVWMR